MYGHLVLSLQNSQAPAARHAVSAISTYWMHSSTMQQLHPPRYWVQVQTGHCAAALPATWLPEDVSFILIGRGWHALVAVLILQARPACDTHCAPPPCDILWGGYQPYRMIPHPQSAPSSPGQDFSAFVLEAAAVEPSSDQAAAAAALVVGGAEHGLWISTSKL